MVQVISLLLENKPGALMRVTGLLSQRGYNIESLTVARTLDPEVSRMTIVVDVDAEKLNEFIDVMQSYGEIEVTRSGALAIALEAKKLKLQPPVPTKNELVGTEPRP